MLARAARAATARHRRRPAALGLRAAVTAAESATDSRLANAAAVAAEQDTIVALASGPGPAAIAVIRVAGPATDGLLAALCGWGTDADGSGATGRRPPPPRTAALVRVRDPATGAVLDPAALALRFPGPASYTGGPCGELHVHGGPAVVDAVLRAATAPATAAVIGGRRWGGGAGPAGTTPHRLRLAEPGEFTRRAVEAGKLDVASAEGVAALTAAVTEAAREAALPLATGEASARFEAWRAGVVGLLARTEASLEWEDDPGGAALGSGYDDGGGGEASLGLAAAPLGAAALAGVAADADALAGQLRRAVAAGARAELALTGARAALVGPPNAGKSSLLNALARRPAAIVAPTPGTTRDVVEVRLDVGGLAVVLADTAGLRGGGGGGDPGACPAEAEGMRRAAAAAAAADVRVAVVDASVAAAELEGGRRRPPPCLTRAAALLLGGPAAATAPAAAAHPPGLLVLNKWDLVRAGPSADAVRAAAAAAASASSPPTARVITCSAATGEGVADLAAALAAAAADAAASPSSLPPSDAAVRVLPIVRARHRELVAAAADALGRAAGLARGMGGRAPPPTELVAEELRAAAEALGGLRAGRRVGTEDVLDEVFARFCVGK